jgi:hypothetical protein
MITVIDAMCGKGKSSYAIQMVNTETARSYIYVTPFLNEVRIIKDDTKAVFVEPDYKDGRKLNGFNELLRGPDNIVVTHCTFSNATDETVELIKRGKYTLILDEVIDVVDEFRKVAVSKDKKIDIKLLLNEGFIEVDEFNRVKWVGESYDKGVFSEIERMAKRGNLLLVDNTLFLWEFPVDVFKAFDEVLILTYMFEGSYLRYYLEYNELEYKLHSVEQIGSVEKLKYRLVDYVKDDIAERHSYRDNIDILNHEKMNNYSENSFSSTWAKKNLKKGTEETKTLKRNLNNFFRNINGKSGEKATPEKMMWTCYKKYSDLLKGNGYTMGRMLTAKERRLPANKLKEKEREISCFVPCNARASNDYEKRFVLAYLCNMYPNPYIVKFFEQKNKIKVDQDAYALSCLIQWVWRSRIRSNKNPRNIRLYLPSPRMRALFKDWLDGKDLLPATL